MKGKFSTMDENAVQKWLKERRFGNYRELFLNCNGTSLLNHPRRTILRKCGVVDGIRLFNLLQQQNQREKESERKSLQWKGYRDCSISNDIDSEDEESSENSIFPVEVMERLESEETDLDELSESDDLDDPDDLHDENFDNLEAPALIEDRTLLIPQEELSVSNIRNVLSHVSGTHPAEIERIFVEKQESQGKDIKVIVTDEYLQKYAKPLYLANLLCQQFK